MIYYLFKLAIYYLFKLANGKFYRARSSIDRYNRYRYDRSNAMFVFGLNLRMHVVSLKFYEQSIDR